MGLFEKKFCDICGEKIGLLGNRKLEDGNMCKDCAKKISPFFNDRRGSTIAQIKEHLKYREENKQAVENFHVTRTLGDSTKVLLDEEANYFIVTSASRWHEANPDVIAFSQITGCDIDIDENKTEVMQQDQEGHRSSYNPPRYKYSYDFYITLHVNNEWFDKIKFRVNPGSIESKGSIDYREAESLVREIKKTFTQIQDKVREGIITANTPKTAQVCPWCGATTTPDEKGCCEYCSKPVNK